MDTNIHSVAIISGLAAALSLSYLVYKSYTVTNKTCSSRSVSSSVGGGPAAYEIQKAIDEYLDFHYGSPEKYLPFKNGPKESLNFAARCAVICERHCPSLKDITGELGDKLCLDIGCAVGGACFELARSFNYVMGIDYSKNFIEAAERMKQNRFVKYHQTIEGDIKEELIAHLAEDIEVDRVTFKVADACSLPLELSPVDCVLAANLLCRLPDPTKFLRDLPRLVKADGIVVLISPYSWLEQWTPRNKWMGGYKDSQGKVVQTEEKLESVMRELGFECLHKEDISFLIREHSRKYQWGVSQAMIWVKK